MFVMCFMVRAGVRCEGVYSFHLGRLLSILRIVDYNFQTLRVAVYTAYGSDFISDMILCVGRSVIASIGRALCSRFLGGAVVVLLLL